MSGIKGDLFAGGGRRCVDWSCGGDVGWSCGGDVGWSWGANSGGGSGSFFATIFLDAEREKKIGGFGNRI